MTVVTDGQAPYAPTSAVLAVIDAFRERTPRTPVTAENISLIEGVSESLAPRTLQALKLLDLLDSEGEPTGALTGLAQAGRNELPTKLAGVIQEAYAEVFAYRDPATAEPADIQDMFLRYRPASMRDRMVRLFYGLCEAAGIVEEAPRVEVATSTVSRRPRQRGTGGQSDTKPRRDTNDAKGKKGTNYQEGTQGDGSSSTPREGVNRLPEIVAALVSRLPSKDESWSEDEAEWWLAMARMAFPREYGYDTSERAP